MFGQANVSVNTMRITYRCLWGVQICFRKMLNSLEREKRNLVERANAASNKRKENNDAHLKESLIEKWNEYLSAKDELAERKKCLADIDKEILKMQNDLDAMFRQREPSAGKSKTKIDCDKKKHEELLENKLHVVKCLYYILYIYIAGNVDNRGIIKEFLIRLEKRYHCQVNVIFFFFY